MENCIFCKIVKGEVASKKILENEKFLAFLDVNPQVKGHTLIIPKEHFNNIVDFDSNLGKDLIDFIKKVFEILKEKFKSEGFNLVQNNFKSAGQIVDHIHFHILPRKEGDGYSLNL
jgi:histidine triad (HIT) family protein